MASASIGTRLGTRIETGSRHNLQCRLDKARFVHGLSYRDSAAGAAGAAPAAKCTNADEELRRNKVKYMMHKDELVVCTSHNLLGAGTFQKRSLPYPHVITTYAGLADATIDYFVDLCKLDAAAYWARIKSDATTPTGDEMKKETPDLRAMGYSMGVAYAHPHSGDTIGTVQIGGLITVQNGAYEMHTGDLVQWYVQDKEEQHFNADTGKRANASSQNVVMDNRQQHYMRNSGFQTPNNRQCGKDSVFLPKPYHPDGASYMDKLRVFAKCVSSAGKFEKVDILICTQSL
mgnify:CR=1 FL=1